MHHYTIFIHIYTSELTSSSYSWKIEFLRVVSIYKWAIQYARVECLIVVGISANIFEIKLAISAR